MKADVQILPAIEFSTAGEHERDFLDINILGYAIDPTDSTLLEMLDQVIKSRVEQKIRQVERLHTYGLHVPVEEVLAIAGGVPDVRISRRLPSNIIPISFPPSMTSSNSTWPPMRKTPHTYPVVSICGWRMPLNWLTQRAERPCWLTRASTDECAISKMPCAGWPTPASTVSKCTIHMVPRLEVAQQTGSSPALPNSRCVSVCSPPAAATITASANAIGSVRPA